MRVWIPAVLGWVVGCAQGLDAPATGTGGAAGLSMQATGGTGATGGTSATGGTGATGGVGGTGGMTGGTGGSGGATGGTGGTAGMDAGPTGGTGGASSGFDAGPLPADCTDEGAACFGFTASHVNLSALTFAGAPDAVLDCGAITIDTTAGGATFGNWCGTAPTPVVQSQSGGPDVVVIPLNGLALPTGNSIVVTGALPVVFAVRGNVTIAGTIDASANGATGGPGAGYMCGTATGGVGMTASDSGAGGGGGGFTTAGGAGGSGDDSTPGVAGTVRDAATLNKLVGGCEGGLGGNCTEPIGAGGGALSLVVSGRLTVTGTIDVSGGDGSEGCSAMEGGGGTGGGSGGSLVLEAEQLWLIGGTLNAGGGTGGAGYNGGDGGDGATMSGAPGQTGSDHGLNGGGGGGGGYGRLVTTGNDWCEGCP